MNATVVFVNDRGVYSFSHRKGNFFPRIFQLFTGKKRTFPPRGATASSRGTPPIRPREAPPGGFPAINYAARRAISVISLIFAAASIFNGKIERERMSAEADNIKLKVQRRIVTVSALLLVAKFTAYFLTNSVGILTDALESIVNVAAGAISLFSLHLAIRPKDHDHPFGHGKIELISASSEGIMIIIAGIMIIYEAVKRLFYPSAIQQLDLGIWIVALSGAVNYLLGLYSVHVGKRHQSIALVAGGKHLQSDTYSSIGLVAGLLALYLTGLSWIDSALALAFGAIIIATGVSILRKTITGLLDEADERLLTEMAAIVDQERQPAWIDIHNTRIIKSGDSLYIDCDLTVPWFYTVEEGHRLGRALQETLNERYDNRIQLTVHIDPCDITEASKCAYCPLPGCPHRKTAFKERKPIDVTTFTDSEPET